MQPDFTRLPERIAPEDMTTTQDVDPPDRTPGGARHRHGVHAAQRGLLTLVVTEP